MDQKWLGLLLAAAVAAVLTLFSEIRKKRIRPFVDAFAEAFCEAAEHIMPKTGVEANCNVEQREGGTLALLPMEQQPEAIRALFSQGVDEYLMQRIRTMFEMRQKAQEHLSGMNLIGKKINGVLNSTYDLMNLSLSLIKDPELLCSQKDLDAIHYFLHKQVFIRNVTLAAVVSEECRQKIAV